MTYQPRKPQELVAYLDSYGAPIEEDDRRFLRAVRDVEMVEPTPELVAAVFRYLHRYAARKYQGNVVARVKLRRWLAPRLTTVASEFLAALEGRLEEVHIDLLVDAHEAGIRDLGGKALRDIVDELARKRTTRAVIRNWLVDVIAPLLARREGVQ